MIWTKDKTSLNKSLALILLASGVGCADPVMNKRTPPPRFEIGVEPSPSPTPIGEEDPEAEKKKHFAAILKIFKQPQYGPCTTCHATEWPLLVDAPIEASWQRFKKSLDNPKSPAKNLTELAHLIYACSDIIDETHCSGEVTDPSDNIDIKMPSKFGFDPLTPDHLAMLKKWSQSL